MGDENHLVSYPVHRAVLCENSALRRVIQQFRAYLQRKHFAAKADGMRDELKAINDELNYLESMEGVK